MKILSLLFLFASSLVFADDSSCKNLLDHDVRYQRPDITSRSSTSVQYEDRGHSHPKIWKRKCKSFIIAIYPLPPGWGGGGGGGGCRGIVAKAIYRFEALFDI